MGHHGTRRCYEYKNDDKKLQFDPIPSRTEEIAKIVLDAAYQVHTALGQVC
jgi:hypothetical protein